MKIEVFVDGEEGIAMLTDQSLLWAARTGNASFEACYKDVQQILVSKKLPTNVKLVLEGSSNPGTYMLRFLSKTDAAAAVDAMSGRVVTCPPQPSLSDSKTGYAAPTHSSAVLHHICASLVEDGVVEQELVDEANAKFRGVLHVFEAINELVDANTLQLRPITDQLLSDIFHQLPLLAHLFALRVKSEHDKLQFVESMVKKYFCYKLTPLDSVQEGEVPAGHSLAPAVGVHLSEKSAGSELPPLATVAAHLSFLNAASAHALLGPTVKAESNGNDFSPPDDMFFAADSAALAPKGQGAVRGLSSDMFLPKKRDRSPQPGGRGPSETSRAFVPLVPTAVPSKPTSIVPTFSRGAPSTKGPEYSKLRRFWQSPATAAIDFEPVDLIQDETLRKCVARAQEYRLRLVRRGQLAVSSGSELPKPDTK